MELGATIFVDKNYILYGSAKEFGFDINPNPRNVGPTAFWDGERVRLMLYENGSDSQMLYTKYGQPLSETFALSENITEQFLKLYNEPHFPFPDLTKSVADLGLDIVTGITGAQFLDINGVRRSTCICLTSIADRDERYQSNLHKIMSK